MNDRIHRKMYPLTMALPALLLFTFFYVLSTVLGLGFSLTDWNARNTVISFIGLDNFKMLLGEEHFLSAIRNNIFFALVASTLKLLLGLALALVLNISFKGRNAYRAIFYMPSIMTTIVVGYIFKFIFQPRGGLINTFFASQGMEKLAEIQWLGSDLAIWAVLFVEVWMWSGYNGTIFLAGLQSIPTELEEAARMDGASRWQVFRHIRWPFLFPSLSVLVTVNLIGGFKMFDLVFAMTNGGPGFATETLSTFLYKAQARGSMGYASCIGVVQFFIITAVCTPIFLYLKKKEREL